MISWSVESQVPLEGEEVFGLLTEVAAVSTDVLTGISTSNCCKAENYGKRKTDEADHAVKGDHKHTQVVDLIGCFVQVAEGNSSIRTSKVGTVVNPSCRLLRVDHLSDDLFLGLPS